MKQILPLLMVCVLLSSCATILNSPQTSIAVYTTEPSKIIVGEDTIVTQKNRAKISVLRGDKPLKIIAETDSLNKTIYLPPKYSGTYWLNLMYTSFIGMIIEHKNPKVFTYQKVVSLNSADTSGNFSKHRPTYHKGEMYLHLSLPHMNHFYLQPPEEATSKNNLGFFGLSLGMDYYHSKNQYINLSGSTSTDILLPFPAPIDFGGEHEQMSTLYFSLSNNHKIKRLSLGYGITYVENIWDLRYYDQFDPAPPSRDSVRKVTENLGLIFFFFFQTGSRFNIGLVYRPTFIRLRPQSPSKYEHLISLDFAWKFQLPD
ncbi:MAG: hypothetical protein AB8B69_12205 [Chitinophagales bacterium]